LGLIINISTPCKATIEEERYDIIKRREILHDEVLVSELWWSDISFLARKKEWYDEQRRILPGWYFRQENECSHELPMGAVFQNVEYGKYPDWLMESIKDQPQCNGIDWNPVSGHKLVGIKWTPDYNHIIVMEEIDLGKGYAVDLSDKMFANIAVHASFGNHVNYECSGINEEYVKWIQKKKGETGFNYPNQNWHSEEWDSAGINKLKIVSFIIQGGVCIWIDNERFPSTAKEVGDCRWDSESETPKLEKKPAASPHYLDSFLHAASEENRRDTQFTFGEWY
jgi:hypothetical protein